MPDTIMYQAPRVQKRGMKELFNARKNGQAPSFENAMSEFVQRHDQFAVDSQPGLIYSCGLFDLCGDNDLMSLVYGQDAPFIQWLTWQLTRYKVRKKYYISYIAPEGAAADAPTTGVVTDCCEPGESVEWGICDYELKGFGKYRRTSPIRCLTDLDQKLCEQQPIYTMDGVAITDDGMWDKLMGMRGIYQDLYRAVINGDGSQPGEFNGIKNLINDEYVNTDGERCTSMDSICIDWDGAPLSASAGATWNGEACPDGSSLLSVMEQVFRTIKDRIMMSSTLGTQNLDTNSGDIIILGPRACLRCLLDAFVCWSVCPGGQYNEVNLNTYEARNFRNSLQGGLYNMGSINFDNNTIHLMAHDWATTDADDPTNCTLYMLTGSVGSIPVLFGELYDMRAPAARSSSKDYTDGGRVLTWSSEDETCIRHSVEMMPRIVNEAPFLQAKFENVPCGNAAKTPSADPLAPNFPEQNPTVAPSNC